jgi:hypothetical protein
LVRKTRAGQSVKLPVETVGSYTTPDGVTMPFAITGYRDSRQMRAFDTGGNLAKTISLPDWTANVQAVDWPKPGHLLIGAGNTISVLDSQGKEVLRHVIRDTSFNPYHGPDGTAVHFLSSADPYLAVMSHGSSGYARSVLLLFDPKGKLVWQEETNKLRAILAVPKPTGHEVLLVGGTDGVVEYSLPPEASPTVSSNAPMSQ